VGVSRSCYYEFKYHVPSDRQIRRLLLSGLIADIHKRSTGTYGMLRRVLLRNKSSAQRPASCPSTKLKK
jgi:hypothetical protein